MGLRRHLISIPLAIIAAIATWFLFFGIKLLVEVLADLCPNIYGGAIIEIILIILLFVIPSIVIGYITWYSISEGYFFFGVPYCLCFVFLTVLDPFMWIKGGFYCAWIYGSIGHLFDVFNYPHALTGFAVQLVYDVVIYGSIIGGIYIRFNHKFQNIVNKITKKWTHK